MLTIFIITGYVTAAQNWERGYANAPGKIYLRTGIGYGIRYASQVSFNGYPADGSLYEGPQQMALDYKKFSFGTGPTAHLTAGWVWNKWFGMEAAISGALTPVRLTYDHYNGYATKPNGTPDTLHYITTTSAQPLYATIALCGKTSYSRLNSYGRIGMAIPIRDDVRQVITNEPALFSNGVLAVTETETVFRSRFSVGVHGAIGISYSIGRHTEMCIEAFGLLRNTYVQSSDLVSYKVDGKQQNDMYRGPHHIDYEFSYNTAQNKYQTTTFVLPFSSLGTSLGLKYTF